MFWRPDVGIAHDLTQHLLLYLTFLVHNFYECKVFCLQLLKEDQNISEIRKTHDQ